MDIRRNPDLMQRCWDVSIPCFKDTYWRRHPKAGRFDQWNRGNSCVGSCMYNINQFAININIALTLVLHIKLELIQGSGEAWKPYNPGIKQVQSFHFTENYYHGDSDHLKVSGNDSSCIITTFLCRYAVSLLVLKQ